MTFGKNSTPRFAVVHFLVYLCLIMGAGGASYADKISWNKKEFQAKKGLLNVSLFSKPCVS